MAGEAKIFNQDIVFIIEHINRYIDELTHSQSSPVNGMIDADKARLRSYIAALGGNLRIVAEFNEGTVELGT
jgi:hypothetical protein